MASPAYVALALCPGIGRARMESLLAAFGTAEAVLGARQADLRAVPGFGGAAAGAVARLDAETGRTALARAAELGGVALAPNDPGFPPPLADIPDAPVLLFVAGRTELLTRPAVAIVGSRAHTRYGAEVCRHFSGGLARCGLTVVSGMARGIDATAHHAALDVGGATVGILGNGLGVVYPSANRALYERMGKDGCLLTEFPPGERPNAGSFPRRNRLISGLARATLVIEARDGSGALITVDSALRQGRDVLAVPGPITSPVSNGCNRLIQHGAKAALGLRDVLEEYGIAPPETAAAAVPTDLSDRERQALQLFDAGDRHIDDVAATLAVGPAEAMAVLTSLEIRGLVRQDAGKVFGLVRRMIQ